MHNDGDTNSILPSYEEAATIKVDNITSTNNSEVHYYHHYPYNGPSGINDTTTHGWNTNVPIATPPPMLGYYGNRGYWYGTGMLQLPPDYWKYMRLFLFVVMATFGFFVTLYIISVVRDNY